MTSLRYQTFREMFSVVFDAFIITMGK